MATVRIPVYGIGGYLPDMPDNNIVDWEEREDWAPAPGPVAPTDAEIESARTSLAAATTVSQTKSRALALDDLRAAQIAALSPVT